jgi:hypothetical protein
VRCSFPGHVRSHCKRHAQGRVSDQKRKIGVFLQHFQTLFEIWDFEKDLQRSIWFMARAKANIFPRYVRKSGVSFVASGADFFILHPVISKNSKQSHNFFYIILIFLFLSAHNPFLIYYCVKWFLHINKRRCCSFTLSG